MKTKRTHKLKLYTAILLPIIMVTAYIVTFRYGVSNSTEVWGQFGSYVGGVIGTIITIYTLFYVYLAYKQSLVRAQVEQVHKMIDHLIQEIQNCEVNGRSGKKAYSEIFQNWKNITFVLNALIDKTKFTPDEIIELGYFMIYYGFDTGNNKYIVNGYDHQKNGAAIDAIHNTCRHFNKLFNGRETEKEYQDLMSIRKNGCQTELSSFYRQIFAIYKFISESEIVFKYETGKLLRNQLTAQIQGLIAVNFKTKYGEEWNKLGLIDFFNPIKNIEVGTFSCINKSPKDIFPNLSFEYNELSRAN